MILRIEYYWNELRLYGGTQISRGKKKQGKDYIELFPEQEMAKNN